MNGPQDAIVGVQQFDVPFGVYHAHIAGSAFATLIQLVGTW